MNTRLVLVAGAALALAGCGKSGTTGEAAATPSAAPVVGEPCFRAHPGVGGIAGVAGAWRRAHRCRTS